MDTLTKDAGRARLTVTRTGDRTADGRETWRYTIAEIGDEQDTVLERRELL